MFSVYKYLNLLIIFSLFIFSHGCSSGQTSAEEHLEHHIPEHYPASYGDAVHSLMDRFDGWKSSQNISDQQAAELHDIIAWLPDIAADSDLKKTDWDQVQQIHKKLLEHYLALKKDAKQDKHWLAVHEQLEELHSMEDRAGNSASHSENSSTHKHEHTHPAENAN